jgi:hypothetical protein
MVFKAGKVALLAVILLSLSGQVEHGVFRNTARASTALDRAIALEETTAIVAGFATKTNSARIIILALAASTFSRSAEITA